MARSRSRIGDFVARLQAFHGFNIEVRTRQGFHPNTRVWEVRVPKTGFCIAGKHAEIMAALKGYQAGFLAGRIYSREEQQGLRDLIAQVEAKFKVA